MNLVEQFGMQQKQYFGNNWQKKNAKTSANGKNIVNDKKKEADKANSINSAKADKTNNSFHVDLSDKAKSLLEELQQKYGNMDFIVANYDSEEEAQRLLSRGTKEYSVLIDPDTLEAMAADNTVKEKYMGIIEDSANQLKQMMDDLGEDGQEVTRVGVVIHNDGSVSYFAELEQITANQKERIEAAREERKAEEDKNEKRAERQRRDEALQERIEERRVGLWQRDSRNSLMDHAKRTTVKADSIEELMEAIRNVNWDQVKSRPFRQTGGRFDFSF